MIGPAGGFYLIKPPSVSCRTLDLSWSKHIEPAHAEFLRGVGLTAFVTAASKPVLRRAVECMAYYFRREFGYTFVQYCAVEPDDETKSRAFLWADPLARKDGKITVFGACCFRWREWEDAPPGYSLDFVWIHPSRRRQGTLAKAWPGLRRLFGDEFHIQDPISPEMLHFLLRQHHRPLGRDLDALRVHSHRAILGWTEASSWLSPGA